MIFIGAIIEVPEDDISSLYAPPWDLSSIDISEIVNISENTVDIFDFGDEIC